MNWIFGNAFVKSVKTVCCHFGCRCISTSSIRTIPGVCFGAFSKWGFNYTALYAMSATKPIIFLIPSLSCISDNSPKVSFWATIVSAIFL